MYRWLEDNLVKKLEMMQSMQGWVLQYDLSPKAKKETTKANGCPLVEIIIPRIAAGTGAVSC